MDLADLFRASLATEADRRPSRGTRAGAALPEHRGAAPRRAHARELGLGELPGDAPVPPLILQPLVENAVYHGIQPSSEPGEITSSAATGAAS
jgi:two-component system sensor histidine kinase AlgZ